ncbi:UDP-N-acetylglucosamine transporter [Entamoeba marina]
MNKLLLCVIFIVCLTLQNTALSIITRYSRGILKETYSMGVAILLSETLKLLISFVGIVFTIEQDRNLINHIKYIISNSLISSVPALIYFCQNLLLQVSLSSIPPALYSIISQVKIISAAILSVLVLHKSITITQWRALAALCFGVISVESSTRQDQNITKNDDGGYIVGVMSALLAAIGSGFSGVYMEKILKNKQVEGPKLNVWERNLQLSIFSGILVALVMLYADVVVKGFAVSLAIVLTAFCSWVFFGTPITVEFGIGAITVIISVFNYQDITASYQHQNPDNNSQQPIIQMNKEDLEGELEERSTSTTSLLDKYKKNETYQLCQLKKKTKETQQIY